MKLIAAIDRLSGLDPAHIDKAALLSAHRLALAKCRERLLAEGEWASHTEELTRKATDAAHAAVFQLSEGTLSREAAHAALGAIIDSTSGLIDRDALDTINQAYRSLRS